MARFENLEKKELLRIMRAYDKYIKDFFEIEEHESMIPICLNEFYDNEYGYYLEVGDIVKFGTFIDDEDLSKWLDNNAKNGILRYRVVKVEDDRFYIENCSYGILLDEDWERAEDNLLNCKEKLECDYLENDYLKQKFIQEFRADRVIDEIMDFCDNRKLNNFMCAEFRENVDMNEFRTIFNDLDDEEFIEFMNNCLGFNLEDIDDYNKKI